MNNFALLVDEIDSTNNTNEKKKSIIRYLSVASEQDKVWMIYLFSGGRIRKSFTTTMLRQWVVDTSGMPQWLFEECYSFTGDLAETITLLMGGKRKCRDYSLSELIGIFSSPGKNEISAVRESVTGLWKSLDRRELFAFNKLITGGFRLGVSSKLLINSIAEFESVDSDLISYRLSGKWDPLNITYSQLTAETDKAINPSKPYPFGLAYSLEGEIEKLGSCNEWSAEWKWDGIRAQLIRRDNRYFVWSRGDEIITNKFPELESSLNSIPDGVVLDGELICYSNNKPMSFNILQKRIGRKNLTAKIRAEAPVVFVAYDMIEHIHTDIRSKPFLERRLLLEQLLSNLAQEDVIKLSPLIYFSTWKDLASIRELSLEKGVEGLMLKRSNSSYHTGRKKGDWWKWKIDPMTVDAVLIYAQSGHGKRSGLYTDYTFGLWDKGKLVTIAKAYSGLTNKEIEEVDKFVKENTLERFGPVRTVKPELVFEIAFEGIAESSRHKSGVALRFPRIRRWRKDKRASEADNLQSLMKLIVK